MDYIQIPALGRPCYLGQAYNALTGTLINRALLNSDAIREAFKSEAATYYESDTSITQTTTERGDFLKVHASVTANILGGAMEVKGSADYLDQRNVKENSTTISIKVVIHDRQDRIDLNNETVRMEGLHTSPEDLKSMSATHIVTSILYGGTILATATESGRDETTSDAINGQLDIKIKNAFDILGSAEGGGKLKMEEKKALNAYNLELKIMGDAVISDSVPTTISTLTEYMSKARQNLPAEKLVPVLIQLTPIAHRFVDVSAAAFYQELEDRALGDLIEFYDTLVSLAQSQATITRQVQEASDVSKFFPSLVQRCIVHDRDAQLLLVEFRSNMGKYLRDKRANPLTVTEDFGSLPFIHPLGNAEDSASNLRRSNLTIREAFNACEDANRKDQADWADYTPRLKNPLYWSYLTAPEMLEKMDIGQSGTAGFDILSILIVPDDSNTSKLLQLYDFKKDILDRFAGQPVAFYSIYPDALLDESFMLAGVVGFSAATGGETSPNFLMEAILKARSASEPVLLFLARSHQGQGAIEWQVPSQRGWGLIVDTVATTRYIGEISNDKPHGYGKREYYDKSMYEGNWVQGIRSGYGKLTEVGKEPLMGLFMDGKPAADGVPVDIILYDEQGYPQKRVQAALPSTSALDASAWEKQLDAAAGALVESPELISYMNNQISRIATALGMVDTSPLSMHLIVQAESGYYPRHPSADWPRGFTIICDDKGNYRSHFKAFANTMDEMVMFDYLKRRSSPFWPPYEMQPIRIWKRKPFDHELL